MIFIQKTQKTQEIVKIKCKVSKKGKNGTQVKQNAWCNGIAFIRAHPRSFRAHPRSFNMCHKIRRHDKSMNVYRHRAHPRSFRAHSALIQLARHVYAFSIFDTTVILNQNTSELGNIRAKWVVPIIIVGVALWKSDFRLRWDGFGQHSGEMGGFHHNCRCCVVEKWFPPSVGWFLHLNVGCLKGLCSFALNCKEMGCMVTILTVFWKNYNNPKPFWLKYITTSTSSMYTRGSYGNRHWYLGFFRSPFARYKCGG